MATLLECGNFGGEEERPTAATKADSVEEQAHKPSRRLSRPTPTQALPRPTARPVRAASAARVDASASPYSKKEEVRGWK